MNENMSEGITVADSEGDELTISISKDGDAYLRIDTSDGVAVCQFCPDDPRASSRIICTHLRAMVRALIEEKESSKP